MFVVGVALGVKEEEICEGEALLWGGGEAGGADVALMMRSQVEGEKNVPWVGP